MATKKKVPKYVPPQEKPKPTLHPITLLKMLPDTSKEALAAAFAMKEALRGKSPGNIQSAKFLNKVYYAFEVMYQDEETGQHRIIRVIDEPVLDPDARAWLEAAKIWWQENPE